MSAKKEAESSVKAVECLICGKIFARGIVDLQRHQAAVTLKHVFHHKKTAAFPHGCEKCHVWFGTEEHLASHKVDSSCNPNKPPCVDSVVARALAEAQKEENNRKAEVSGPSPAEGTSSPSSSSNVEKEWIPKILECMVCGKFFPRGIVDLTRHSQAPTLQHMFNSKKTKVFSVSCPREGCNLWFASLEHKESHMAKSTCNAAVVEALRKAALTAANSIVEVASPGKRERDKISKAANIAASKARAASTKMAKKQEREQALFGGVRGLVEDDFVAATHDSKAFSRRERTESTTSDYMPRSKRSRVLVPDDRKAFFSVASLMIDESKVPMGTKLSTENFETFIDPAKLPALQRLKDQLLYDC